MTATSRLTAFMTAAGVQIRRHDSDVAQQISRALGRAQAAPPALQPAAAMPACDVLPDLLAGAEDDLGRLLAACAGDLHWRMAGFGKLPEAAQGSLAVSELVGPDGLFPASDVRLGLLIQREGFQYPQHWHAAEEVYLVLKGTALWSVDDAAPTSRGPGSIIVHASRQPHAIRTVEEPICALWGWVGDIAGGSYSA